jgi:hypothetical protein
MIRWAVVLALAALAGSATATQAAQPHGAARLQDRAVLRALGIPPPRAVRLQPVFRTGFERDSDLAGFYVTPQSPLTRHEVRSTGAHRGQRAHVGWLTGATGSEPVDGPNHRGYPTIQLQKRSRGACRTPCVIRFWARIEGFALGPGEWVSLATLSPDPSDRWSRVVTVNVGWEGWLHLFHVPDQGRGERVYQRTDTPFPVGPWVRVTIWLDLAPSGGAAAVWQNGTLMSAARVRGGDGTLDQLHFGLYAPPSLTRGAVWNDDIAVFQARRRRR